MLSLDNNQLSCIQAELKGYAPEAISVGLNDAVWAVLMSKQTEQLLQQSETI